MLEQLRYVRIPVGDLSSAKQFASEIVGLEPSESPPDRARFRSDARAYSLDLDGSGSTATPTIGIEVRFENQLCAIGEALAARGVVSERVSTEGCDLRRCRAALAFRDSSGNAFELVVRPDNRAPRYFPSRDAGIIDLSHVAVGCVNVEADVAIWTEALGARVTDRVGQATYLSWDDQHHRLALHPTSRQLCVVTYKVESIDAVMQNSYFLSNRQVRIVRGPGREPTSGEVFLTFEGPGNVYFAYATEPSQLKMAGLPRQFVASAESFCSWGSFSDLPEFGGKKQS